MVSQRVNAERVMLLAWPRAILLQVAHPLVAAGVAEHSSFADGGFAAVHRLWQTVQAMLALTFGDEVEQHGAIEGILAIHRRVHGTLRETVGRFPAGTRYSAEDPDLVLWVHVTLLESMVLAHDALLAPLSGDERDAYCAESAWVPVALGARAEDVPATWAARAGLPAARPGLGHAGGGQRRPRGGAGRALAAARAAGGAAHGDRALPHARVAARAGPAPLWIVVDGDRRAAAAARPGDAARGAAGDPARGSRSGRARLDSTRS